VTVSSSTLSGNSVFGTSGVGGGIFNSSGTLQTRNTIIAGNTASIDPDVSGDLGSQGRASAHFGQSG
jgi:hypothetical protein